MNTMKPLNTKDGWEDIVNPHSKVNQRRRGRRKTGMLVVIVLLLAVVLLVQIAWLLNVCGAIESILISQVLCCVASFIFGRLWEMTRR